jgi:hypothetical protein
MVKRIALGISGVVYIRDGGVRPSTGRFLLSVVNLAGIDVYQKPQQE